MNLINQQPLEAIQNLLRSFPIHPEPMVSLYDGLVPLGIEVEVSWRSFFPDLWVKGFPNIEPQLLKNISDECSRREKTLLPDLVKVSNCGIPRGADKYWEFAFPPVTDVSITCHQVEILKANNLIPKGNHNLHITLGGLKNNRDVAFLALLLESRICTSERILSGFNNGQGISPSQRWARKGSAGLFQKEGDGDLKHGYAIASEIRLLTLPENSQEVFTMLSIAQKGGEIILKKQSIQEKNEQWESLVKSLSGILNHYHLPDKNWRSPHLEPAIWKQYAKEIENIKQDIQKLDISFLFPTTPTYSKSNKNII